MTAPTPQRPTRRSFLKSLGGVAGAYILASTLPSRARAQSPWPVAGPAASGIAYPAAPRPSLDPRDASLEPGLVQPHAPVPEDRSTPLAHGESVAGIYRGERLGEAIALTFDDVPRRHFTRRALDWLAAESLTATFFVQGEFCRVLPDHIKRMVDEGHELGNHGYSHTSFATLSAQGIHDELDRTQEMVDRALGRHHPLRLVRPPYGAPWVGRHPEADRERVARVISERNAFLALWQLSTGDTRPGCTDSRVRRHFRDAVKKHRGGAMVFHPMNCSRQALRPILRMIRQREIATTSVQALLEMKYQRPLGQIASLPTAARYFVAARD